MATLGDPTRVPFSVKIKLRKSSVYVAFCGAHRIALYDSFRVAFDKTTVAVPQILHCRPQSVK
jgi:hypothetical protein